MLASMCFPLYVIGFFKLWQQSHNIVIGPCSLVSWSLELFIVCIFEAISKLRDKNTTARMENPASQDEADIALASQFQF